MKLYECAIGLTRMDPKDMLCIGDSVGELEPAKKLGIETIGVLTGFSSKEDMEIVKVETKFMKNRDKGIGLKVTVRRLDKHKPTL